ncbi:sulfatase-like hydrolase/transferase [Shimia abyssi]|uniref:Arylsulfatase A-like enzyme n=1 Tax=Shimia abyssi TaxID=1662395 RepID=A0A2P8F1X1_9RHOB|nr:sulfatase-like hydrolase/transferase [Shimia abyssi]PSL15699.1 arylsulfatase A-like enzyme [Shimia abyssi]
MSHANVLWIVADHQAFANRGVDPSLFPLQSRLQKLGTSFSRAYTVLPICSPSRATMLTGQYPHTHGVTENDGRFGGRAELDQSDHLIQHDFADAGYRCGWFGKWHLSQTQSAQDFGFEGFSLPGYGYPYGTPEYRAYLAQFHDGSLWAEVESPGESRRATGEKIDLTAEDAWFDYEAGTALLHGPEEVHEAFFLADASIKWLEKVRETDATQPFFLRIDTWGPHPPYTMPTGFSSPLHNVQPSENLNSDLSQRPEHHRDYRDRWKSDLRPESLDWDLLSRRALEHCILVERALERLVDHLEATGELENTVIVFCSDHGDAVASNGGVMNKGSLMVEETMRIPLLFSGPKVRVGWECNHLVGNVDIAPTLHELCGIPAGLQMQGNSVAKCLTDPDAPPARERLMTQHYGLHVPILQRALYRDRWKYVIQSNGFDELYDLENDPSELLNLANHSTATEQKRLMRSELAREMQVLGDDDPRLATMKSVLETGLR